MMVRVQVQIEGRTQVDVQVDVDQVKADEMEAAVKQAVSDVLDQGPAE